MPMLPNVECLVHWKDIVDATADTNVDCFFLSNEIRCRDLFRTCRGIQAYNGTLVYNSRILNNFITLTDNEDKMYLSAEGFVYSDTLSGSICIWT